MKEVTLRVTRYQEVGVTVIVIVANGDADSVQRDAVDTCLCRNLLEFAVPDVVVESVTHRVGTLAPRRFTSVNKKNIHQSVPIEIEEGGPAIFRFDQMSIGRFSVEVLPGDAGRRGDVCENVGCDLRTGGSTKGKNQQACGG